MMFSRLCLTSFCYCCFVVGAPGVASVNTTEKANCTSVEPISKTISSVFAGVSILNAFTNLLLLVSVRLTPSLKGITGWLILNEATSSFLFQLTFVCGVIFGDRSSVSSVVIPSIGRSFYLASTVFLTFQNFNMYLAVCCPTSKVYQIFKSSRSTAGILLTTWVFVALVGVTSMQDIFHDQECDGGIKIVTMNDRAKWLPVTIISFGVVLPLVSDVFCLLRVLKASSEIAPIRSFRQEQQRLHSQRLSKFIILNSIALSATFFPFVIVNSITLFTMPTTSIRLALVTTWACFLIYSSFRPVVYFTCYKPLRRTARKTFCGQTMSSSNAINIAVLPR